MNRPRIICLVVLLVSTADLFGPPRFSAPKYRPPPTTTPRWHPSETIPGKVGGERFKFSSEALSGLSPDLRSFIEKNPGILDSIYEKPWRNSLRPPEYPFDFLKTDKASAPTGVDWKKYAEIQAAEDAQRKNTEREQLFFEWTGVRRLETDQPAPIGLPRRFGSQTVFPKPARLLDGNPLDLTPQALSKPSDPREKVLLDFFSYLTGGKEDDIYALSTSLVKFGSKISSQFCSDLIHSEFPTWLHVSKDTSQKPVLKKPSAAQNQEAEVRQREYEAYRARVLEFAQKRCIDWPVEVWSTDQRMAANPDRVQLYPGRIVVQKIEDFKILRNRFPKAHMVLKNSKNPRKGLASLSVVPKDLKLIFDTPRSLPDAVRIYGDAKLPMSWAHQTAYFESALLNLGGKSLSKIRAETKSDKFTMVAEVRQAIRDKAPLEALVIVAHCENGFLKFSDGSRLSVNEIEQSDAKDSPIIIMACDTLTHFGDSPGLKFATAKSISYDEAIFNTTAIRNAISGQKPIGEAFQNIQMDELDRQKFQPNPAKPAATGQASIQLVEATNMGVIAIHSNTSAIAFFLSTREEIRLAKL